MFDTEQSSALWNARYSGAPAFTHADKDGYKVGTILGKSYKAHRIAWFLAKGEPPPKRIDHIDGDRSNNRIENLRDAPWVLNCRNRSMGTKNTSGVVGVRWERHTGKWHAYVKLDGRLINLGRFNEKHDAIAARGEGLKNQGFTERHGLPPQ